MSDQKDPIETTHIFLKMFKILFFSEAEVLLIIPQLKKGSNRGKAKYKFMMAGPLCIPQISSTCLLCIVLLLSGLPKDVHFSKEFE